MTKKEEHMRSQPTNVITWIHTRRTCGHPGVYPGDASQRTNTLLSPPRTRTSSSEAV